LLASPHRAALHAANAYEFANVSALTNCSGNVCAVSNLFRHSVVDDLEVRVFHKPGPGKTSLALNSPIDCHRDIVVHVAACDACVLRFFKPVSGLKLPIE